MDSTTNLPLDFLETDELPTFTTPNQPQLPRSQIFSTNPSFKSPSPTPSPSNLNFNPDDFLASPPQSLKKTTALKLTPTLTPELKRRLFSNDVTASLRGSTPPNRPAADVVLQQQEPKRPQRTKCNCKASKCLKLYCPCFAQSEFCADTCTCKNCQNTRTTQQTVREARQTVLARDPRAFEPKVRNTPATRDNIHTKGCNCRKGCGKNYCVCRELFVACGPRCTCSGPKGCLNGKIDGLKHLQQMKDDIGITKIGPPPVRYLSGLPPPKFARMKPSLKQKREKRKSFASPSPKMGPLLSPSFPGINIDTSPTVDLQSLEDFRKVMGDDGFVTPFTLRKGSFRPIEDLTTDKEGKRTLSAVLQDPTGVDITITPLSVKRRISLEVLDDPKQEPTVEEDLKHKPQTKRIRMHADLIDNNQKPAAPSASASASASGDDKTPDQQGRISDIKFATSPTTGEKDGVTRLVGQPLFGRQDKIQVCRLPRILRVKMGSGKPLRKFDL